MQDYALTHGLWAHTAPPPPDLEKLEGNHQTDVAVIGGGYTGLSAALHLAEAGIRTICLESESIGYGGAGRNVGLVNAGLWLMPDDVVKILGPDYGERLITVLGASPDLVFGLIEKHGISCEGVRKGTLHCAHSPGGFKALAQREAQWKRRGAPVVLLDAGQAAPEIGSSAFYGALLDKRAGTIQPLAYAYGLANAALRSGAQIYAHSPVIALKRTGRAWLVETPSGAVQAESVILAVQGYADHAFRKAQNALIPFNFFQFATPPLPDHIRATILPGGQGAWDTSLILSSFRLDAAGRLIVGSVGQVENMAFRLHEKWARRTICKVFPQIIREWNSGQIPLIHGWHGRIAMTADHVPRFHLLDENLVTVTSYNGRGIGPGTVFGKLLAEYVQKRDVHAVPLPVTKPENIFMRSVRGLFYEAGARVYHVLQRRLGPFF